MSARPRHRRRRAHHRRRRSYPRRRALLAAFVPLCALAAVLAGWQAARGQLPSRPISSRKAAAIRHGVDRAAGRRTDRGPVAVRHRLPVTEAHHVWRYRQVPLRYDGRARRYLVITPLGVHRRLPVLVELQGCCGEDVAEAHRSAFQRIAAPPAVLVYPQASGPGHEQHWDAGHCCGPAAADHVDDVGFIAAVIARVQRSVPEAAPGKVFLAGYSNGAKMAFRLACTHPGLFAAVAVYAGVGTTTCHRNRPPPLPLLASVGTADAEVRLGPAGAPIVQDGHRQPSVVQEVGFYLRSDACHSRPVVTVAGSLTETLWSCAHGRRVALGVYQGQGHAWVQEHGRTPSVEQVLWDFLAAFGA